MGRAAMREKRPADAAVSFEQAAEVQERGASQCLPILPAGIILCVAIWRRHCSQRAIAQLPSVKLGRARLPRQGP